MVNAGLIKWKLAIVKKIGSEWFGKEGLFK
jgi:hypothetical protein